MNESVPDVIDQLAAVAPGSHLDAIRARRPQAREHAQKSYLALFEPKELGCVSAPERFAVAAFVAGLHAEPATHEFYRSKLGAAAGHAMNRGMPSMAPESGRTSPARSATEAPAGHAGHKR